MRNLVTVLILLAGLASVPSLAHSDDAGIEFFRERSKWWSLQPVGKPDVPQPKQADWSPQAIDRFILAKLEQFNLAPAAPAPPRTLARRLSLVLTGLPPTPEMVERFLRGCELPTAVRGANEDSADRIPQSAVETLVDALLDSPHFGERWARHWMDVVRFTETHGNEWNYEVHHAWRYRDYLIRAFNTDVSFDQFVREHIAGDLLPQPRWNEQEQFNESVIGTGFYRFGEVNHDDCISLREIGFDIADNQIDTLTKAFQATTVACARCHDHKLDAVSMRDYYALLGILRSSRLVAHTIDSPQVNAGIGQRLRELKSHLRRELAGVWRKDIALVARYMQAATAKHAKSSDADQLATGLEAKRLEKWIAALAADKQPQDDVFQPWRLVVGRTPTSGRMGSDVGVRSTDVAVDWRRVAERYAKEDGDQTEANRTQFVTFADFRKGLADGWQVSGQALRDPQMKAGDFVIAAEGDLLVTAILPAGCFTHALSDKLNGTLRSPVLPVGKKNISFEVLGQRSSAVRLVSNNCQLNYKNYRALTKPELSWITFSPPDDRDNLRTYAELMTMFDNPKFPDQLSSLGGDTANYRLPWDKAAENPRSFFGVTRVVLHDGAEPPKAELNHVRPLFAGDALESLADVAARYESTIAAALQRWEADETTDDDTRWLESLLRRELLSNQSAMSPRVESLARELREAESQLALPRVVPGVGEHGPGFDQPVFDRGDPRHPGEIVPRGFLEVLKRPRPIADAGRVGPQGSGRLELADQIACQDNPLTARVIVNRIWHHLFGTGLVRTVDDFGHVGDLPSHPELLDYLAAQFVGDGWSVKKLIRGIVLSRTFQLSSAPSPLADDVDPTNRLLQHFPARRLEAEAIRDAMLFTSGRWDRKLFGPSVQPFREKEYADRRLFPGPLDGDGRRSLYIKNNLMEAPKFLAAFNFPGGKVTQGRRDLTNVPAQALALLNDPFVLQQAEFWAARLVERNDATVAARVDALFESALNRPATDDERRRFEQAATQIADLEQISAGEVLSSRLLWKNLVHAVFNLKEFIYIP